MVVLFAAAGAVVVEANRSSVELVVLLLCGWPRREEGLVVT